MHHATHMLLYWIICILGRWPYITNKLNSIQFNVLLYKAIVVAWYVYFASRLRPPCYVVKEAITSHYINSNAYVHLLLRAVLRRPKIYTTQTLWINTCILF